MDVTYKLTTRHYLQKADTGQIKRIKEILCCFDPNSDFHRIYEKEKKPIINKDSDDSKYEHIQLPPESWRYWIINCEERSRSELQHLGYALGVLEQGIELGFRISDTHVLD